MEDATCPEDAVSAHQLPEGVKDLPLFDLSRLINPVLQCPIAAHLHEDVEIVFGEALQGNDSYQIGMVGQIANDIDLFFNFFEFDGVTIVCDNFDCEFPCLFFGIECFFDDTEASLTQFDICEDEVLMLRMGQ